MRYSIIENVLTEIILKSVKGLCYNAPMPPRYSIIIPTRNEAAGISSLISRIRTLNPAAQIIVVDANSPDQTAQFARNAGAEVYLSPAGRGVQCAAGARQASGDIFVFLHADSRLPENAFSVIDRSFARPDCQTARFRVSFDHPHGLLKFYAWCSQLDTVLTRFGDQGIVVRRSFYERLGGMREWPLLEDVDFFRRARAQARICLLPACITTSARKFVKEGMLRRQISNAWILLRYLGGESPEKLFKAYYPSIT